jgi:N-acetylglucosamine-6-sulfatase
MRLAAITLVATLALAITWGGGDARAQGPTQPNIVMVMTDDQAVGMLSRETMPKTTKGIVKAGTNFTQAIATTPTCCPSRASFITGQYAHNHGVLENDYTLIGDDTSTLPTWLQAVGYRTIHVGKYMNRYKKLRGANEVAPGWDEWYSALEPYSYYDYLLRENGKKVSYGKDDDEYLTRVLNEIALSQLDRAARSQKPFYLQLDHYAPHIAPGDKKRCDGAAVPDPKDMDRFEDEPLPDPPNFNEADVSDKPSFIQGLKQLGKKKLADLERRYGCALASLRGVDRGVDEILTALDDAGELDQTVVIFVSDNGFYYGEHRIPDAKQNPYEEGLRIPLAMRIPAQYLGGAQPTGRVDSLVGNIDVTATILDLAKAGPCNSVGACRTLDGRSLLPLAAGQANAFPQDRALAVELKRIAQNAPVLGGRACTYTGVRTPRHAYIHHTEALNPQTRACEPVNDIEWYDLSEDPFQLSSLHGAAPGSANGVTQAALAERSARLADCAGIQGRDPLPASGHWCE